MNIGEINFGRDTAEFDKNLSDYFLKTSTYKNIMNGNKSIVTGRKGTGKTAIVRYALENENTSREYVLKIEASHSTYVKIDENLKSFVSQVKNMDSSFKLGWLITTLLMLVDRLCDESNMVVTKEETELYRYAKDNLNYDKTDPISAISGYVTSWIKNLKSIGGISREVNSDLTAKFFDEPRLLRLIASAAKRINKRGKRVYFLYDRLDERWDGSYLYVQFIQGLLLAIKDIKGCDADICPVVFLRTDIFDSVTSKFQHIDHYRMEIEEIKWDERELLKLVALRIRTSLERKQKKVAKYTSEELWNQVFDEKIPSKRAPIPSHAYMIERTLFRPRDIILFVSIAQGIALVRNAHDAITSTHIKDAEKVFSKMKRKDLVAEWSYKYPDIDIVIQRFWRKTIGLDLEDLQYTLLELIEDYGSSMLWMPKYPDGLLKLMYRIGFFSFTTRGGHLRGTRVVHSAIEPDENVILTKDRIYISPIFRKALDLKDNKRKKKA